MFKTITPWGEPTSVKEVAPGITWYQTAAHGGFHLSPERNAEVPQEVKESTWGRAGLDGWYEEDCDALIVLGLFPQLNGMIIEL